MIEHEQAKENHKKFLYAQVMRYNTTCSRLWSIKKVVDEYRSMEEDGRNLILLELDLYKSDPPVISHIIYMIDKEIFWHQKTFGAVIAKLWRKWDIQVYKQENMTLHCKINAENHKEMDEKEVVGLCSESQAMTSDQWKAKQNRKKENHDMEESKTATRKANENRPEKDFPAQETIRDEVAMMCWENLEGVLAEESNKETSSQDERPNNDKENQVMMKPKKNMPIVHCIQATD